MRRRVRSVPGRPFEVPEHGAQRIADGEGGEAALQEMSGKVNVVSSSSPLPSIIEKSTPIAHLSPVDIGVAI
jgi:hypothetical protein